VAQQLSWYSIGSHFILSGFKYYVLTFKNKYVLMLYCKSLLLLLRCDMGKVRDRCGGMGRFKGGFKCKGWVRFPWVTDAIT